MAHVEISKRLVLINSLSGVVARLLNVGVLVWLQQHLLRRISPDEYSIYPVVIAVMAFVPLISTVLTGGLSRYIVEAYARGDERRVTQIASTMFILTLLGSTAVLTAGMLFTWQIDRILDIPPDRVWDAQVMLLLLIGASSVQLALTPFNTGLYVRQKFVLEHLITIGAELLRMGLLLVLLLFVSTRVLWISVAGSAGLVLQTIVIFRVSRRLVPALRFDPRQIDWARARELTSFGAWSTVSGVAETIYRSASPLILNKLATAVDVATFNLGSIVVTQLQAMTILVLAPLQPALVAMFATGGRERLRSVYMRGGRYGMWTLLLAGVPLAIYRHELFLLYVGQKYESAGTVMALLLIPFPFGYANVMMGRISIAIGEVRPLAVRMVAIQLMSLVAALYFVGVAGMGAVGCALGTTLVGTVSQWVLMYPLGLKMVGMRFSEFLSQVLVPGAVPAAAGALVWILLRAAISPASWSGLALCMVVGGIVYLAVLLKACLRPFEKDEMLQVFRWALARMKGADEAASAEERREVLT